MRSTEQRERVRAILVGNECVRPAPIFDLVSARLADDVGFQTGWMASDIAESVVLGTDHLVMLTLTEHVEQVRRICRGSDISLIVGAYHGYGNALNVMRTVEEMENAGVSAITIDDAALPRGFGEPEGEGHLTSLEEGVGKMKAALAARQDSSLVIIGRTSALHVGIPEAITRVKAYEKAGVDAIYLSGGTLEGVKAIHAATRLPLTMGQASVESGDSRTLGALGVRIASLGHLAFWASVKAMHETLKSLYNGVSPKDLRTTQASAELKAQVLRRSQSDKWIENFLS